MVRYLGVMDGKLSGKIKSDLGAIKSFLKTKNCFENQCWSKKNYTQDKMILKEVKNNYYGEKSK